MGVAFLSEKQYDNAITMDTAKEDMHMEKLEMLKKWIEESSRIVFFGGAGVSTE